MLEDFGRHRLHEVFGRATLDRPHRGIDPVQRGDDDHFRRRCALLGVAQDVHAVPLRQEQVRHHGVEPVFAQGGLRPRAATVDDRRDVVPGGDQVVAVDRLRHFLVVDQEDPKLMRERTGV